MTPEDVEVTEDVPPEIGENQDWDQARKAMREGYAAFLAGETLRTNPYRLGPGENFSGYKRRKRNDWYRGWQVAAIREGECESKEDVEVRHGLTASLPHRPTQAIYDIGLDREKPAEDVGEWGYYYRGEVYPTRREAIGEAAIVGRESQLSDPKKALRGVRVAERVRRPPLPDAEADEL